MGVNMLTKDPYAAEEMQALRYPTSPSAPQQPTLMDGVKDRLKEKGINMAMKAAEEAAVAGTTKMLKPTDMAMKAAEEAAVAKAGSMLGTAVGGPVVGTAAGALAPGLYEGALKPIFQKLFFDRGGMVGGPLSAKDLRKAQEERFANADENSMAQLAANEAATEDPSFLDRAGDFLSGLMDKRKANNRLVNQGFFMRPSLIPEYYDKGDKVRDHYRRGSLSSDIKEETEEPSFLDRAGDFISGLMDKRKANNKLVNQGFFMRPSLMPEYYNNGGMVGGPLSSMMTNVSKVRYKQSGGKVAEEIELNYHGPLASKGV